MKAIIWKELRENAKWAVLMMLGLAAGFWACQANPDHVDRQLLVGTTMMMLTTLGFSAVGFALGLLQGLQDSGTGRWGFLTHRPISRSRVFFAKALAGVLLYLPATALPLAVTACWVAAPGHVAAPFEWHMVLPRLADLLGGLMWYFAGSLVALRRARWIGSRLMPAGMALVGSMAAFVLPMNFAEVILIIAAVLAILIPAAWGAFVSGGSYEPQPLVARIMTTLCVGIGIFCTFGAAAGMSQDMLRTLSRTEHFQDQARYEIAEDGRILIVKNGPDGSAQVTDLKGNPLPAKLAQSRPSSAAVSLEEFGPRNPDWRQYYWGFQRDTRYLRRCGTTGWTTWYYVVDRGTIEGFDTAHRQFIGSLGPNGFVPPGLHAQPFAELLYTVGSQGHGYNSRMVAAGATAAYQIDVEHKSVIELLDTGPADPILNGDVARDWSGVSTFVPFAIVVTPKTVHVFEDGKERFTVPKRHGMPDTTWLMVSRIADGRYVFEYESFTWGKECGWVVETDNQGQILHETQLPNLPMNISTDPWWTDAPMVVVYPPGILPARLWTLAKSDTDRVEHREVLAAMVIAVIAVLLTCWRLRRVPTSRAAKGWWLVLNALLGFPGLLLLLSLRQRVAAAACPACGQRRLVTGEKCEHCHAPFNAPAALGIEVFE